MPAGSPGASANRRASMLGELFGAVAAATTECEVLAAAATNAVEWIGDMCNVFILSDDRMWFDLAANQARDAEVGENLVRALESDRLASGEGIAGAVLASGRPFVGPVRALADIAGPLTRARVRFVSRHPISSLVAVPMVVRGDTIGVFEVARIDDRVPYTAEDVEFITGIAGRTAMAYDGLRSRRLALAEATRGRILAEFLATAAQASEENTVLEALAQRGAEALEATCIIFRVSTDGSCFDVVAIAGDSDGTGSLATMLRTLQWRSDEGFSGESFQTGETVTRSFVGPTGRSTYRASLRADRQQAMAGLDIRAGLAVPLESESKRLGVFALARFGQEARPFENADVLFAQALAGRADLELGRLLDRQRREDDLRRLAFVDELTGLANRRAVEQSITNRLATLDRRGWEFGLLVIDVDQFKQINDRYGHGVGDDALRIVAQTILRGSRAEDVVGRWGGDEFVVLVSGASPAVLARTKKRITRLVGRTVLSSDGREIGLAVSAGGSIALAGDTIESVFGRADVELYEAKRLRLQQQATPSADARTEPAAS